MRKVELRTYIDLTEHLVPLDHHYQGIDWQRYSVESRRLLVTKIEDIPNVVYTVGKIVLTQGDILALKNDSMLGEIGQPAMVERFTEPDTFEVRRALQLGTLVTPRSVSLKYGIALEDANFLCWMYLNSDMYPDFGNTVIVSSVKEIQLADHLHMFSSKKIGWRIDGKKVNPRVFEHGSKLLLKTTSGYEKLSFLTMILTDCGQQFAYHKELGFVKVEGAPQRTFYFYQNRVCSIDDKIKSLILSDHHIGVLYYSKPVAIYYNGLVDSTEDSLLMVPRKCDSARNLIPNIGHRIDVSASRDYNCVRCFGMALTRAGYDQSGYSVVDPKTSNFLIGYCDLSTCVTKEAWQGMFSWKILGEVTIEEVLRQVVGREIEVVRQDIVQPAAEQEVRVFQTVSRTERRRQRFQHQVDAGVMVDPRLAPGVGDVGFVDMSGHLNADGVPLEDARKMYPGSEVRVVGSRAKSGGDVIDLNKVIPFNSLPHLMGNMRFNYTDTHVVLTNQVGGHHINWRIPWTAFTRKKKAKLKKRGGNRLSICELYGDNTYGQRPAIIDLSTAL